MARGFLLGALCVIWTFGSLASTQRFHDLYQPVNFTGISDVCFTALNSTLDCSHWLIGASLQHPTTAALNHTQEICTPSCLESLLHAQQAATESCFTDADVIWDSPKKTATRASWIIEKLVYGFNSTCLNDPTTGQLCAANVNSSNSTTDQRLRCSHCALGTMNIDLESPLRYSEEEAGEFDLMASSCNATGYTITSPAPTTVNITHPDRSWIDAILAAPTPPFNPNCTRSGKVYPNDTYSSIAAEKNVSSFWLRANDYNADVSFDEILQVGTSYCLPPGKCHVYAVQQNETRNDIVGKVSPEINPGLLEEWNPNISEMCDDAARLKGSVVCLSPLPKCAWCTSAVARTTIVASTFSGCQDQWSTYWPGRTYDSCLCPFAPSSCYSSTASQTSTKSNIYSWWKSCQSGRSTRLTEGFCATAAPEIMRMTASVEAVQTHGA